MASVEITNMIMIQDPETEKVIVEKRVKYWCGYSFPGGHLDPNESVYDSAVREVREETGLEVKNLKPCGLVYWYNRKTGDQYFVHLFKTTEFSGELLGSTDEGEISWVTLDDLRDSLPTAPNFREYLEVFLRDDVQEAFCSWSPDEIVDENQPNPRGIRYC